MLKLLPLIEKEVPRDDSADFGEQLFLYGLIRAMKPHTIVETGTHRGVTSLIMAHAILDEGYAGHVYTCDPYDWGQAGNFRKIPELEGLITYEKVRGDKFDVKDIDLLFIDGFHEREEVLREWAHFEDRLTEHAVVVFHDCGVPNNACDVNGAIEQLGLQTVWLPTHNKLRVYGKGEII